MGKEVGEEERKVNWIASLALCWKRGIVDLISFFLFNNFVIRIIELNKRQWDCGKLFSIGFAGRLHSTKIIEFLFYFLFFTLIGPLLHTSP